MTVKEAIAKALAGEQLDDAARDALKGFDLQAQLDAAAGAARRKAEGEAKKAEDALAALKAEFDEYRAANSPESRQTEVERLMKRVDRLEAEKKSAEEKVAASERAARVRSLAKDAGVTAARGVDPKSLDLLVDRLMGGVDLDDADAVKAAFDGFKGANAALIAAGTVGGAGVRGLPGAGAHGGQNPFSRKSFNLTAQLELAAKDPGLAKSLKDAAAAEDAK